MNKLSKNIRIPAPLFDRLIDENPETTTEPSPLRTYNREQLKDSIQRELQALLNTRPNTKRLEGLEDDPHNIAATTLFYGAHNFSFVDVTSASGKEQVKTTLAQAIENFEPRLTNIQVTITEFERNAQRLKVIIEGYVKIGELREHWSFPVIINDVEISKPQELLAG